MNVFGGDRTLRPVRSGTVRGTDAKSSQLSSIRHSASPMSGSQTFGMSHSQTVGHSESHYSECPSVRRRDNPIGQRLTSPTSHPSPTPTLFSMFYLLLTPCL